MLEAALFYLDFLVVKDGVLVMCPSVSPENIYRLPNGQKGAVSYGVTMDNQILRDLFSQCIKAGEILEGTDFSAHLKEMGVMENCGNSSTRSWMPVGSYPRHRLEVMGELRNGWKSMRNVSRDTDISLICTDYIRPVRYLWIKPRSLPRQQKDSGDAASLRWRTHWMEQGMDY